jgi:NADH:ubiquinone oxidoreductase subunit K
MTILSLYLISLGILLLVYKNNYIFFLVSLELILFGININFLILSTLANADHLKKVSLYLLILAAVETVIGLSLIVGLHTAINSIYSPNASRIKG